MEYYYLLYQVGKLLKTEIIIMIKHYFIMNKHKVYYHFKLFYLVYYLVNYQ